MAGQNHALDVLVANDDPEYAEVPGGASRYDRPAAEAKFRGFAAEAQTLLGHASAVETFPLIQDASFVGQIRLSPEACQNPDSAVLRVSHFGCLVAILDDEGTVRDDVLTQLQALAAAHGYVWIPSDVLKLRYTGRNPGVTGFRTWGHRFFDWI